MNDQELEEFLENCKQIINIENISKIFQKIVELVIEIDDDGKMFYDFLGEVLLTKPHFLETKNYTKLIQNYNVIYNIIDPAGPIELEKYFLEKYCILDEEKIIFYFYGGVNHINYRKGKGLLFLDRVFITNLRIIIFLATFGDKGLGGPIIPNIYTSKQLWIASMIERQIRKKLKKERDFKRDVAFSKVSTLEYEKKLSFGYQFPISNPTAITLDNWTKGKYKGTLRRVSFNSTIDDQSYDLGIVVDKKKHEKWEEMLHKIAEILQNL